MYCYNCGKEIDDKAVVCVHCGVAVRPIAGSIENNWVVALLLCLFLGTFGAHRFYTKHIGMAIAQLLLTLSVVGAAISWPWALVDFILILTGRFKTATGEDLIK